MAIWIDDVTIAGQTVTIWGTVYAVPAGLNLAEFLDDLWIEKIATEGICQGDVTAWEMFTAFGQSKCLINTAACMKPCSSCDEDPPVQRLRRPQRGNLTITLTVTDANGNVATKRELSALDRVLYVGGERLRINLRHCRGRLIGLRPMMQPTGQAAERLQFSKQTVLRLIRAGELRAERIQPGAQYRILEDDLTEYAERRGVTLSPDQEKQNRPGR